MQMWAHLGAEVPLAMLVEWKTAEGLNSSCGVKTLQDRVCDCLGRKDEQRVGAPGELGKLLELGELRERWRASVEKGIKAFQKRLSDRVVETGEVRTHRCREEGK